jgi:serine/threonine protein kinase
VVTGSPPDAPTGPQAADDQRTVLAHAVHVGPGLPVGHAVQEYVIDSLIGEGGFGIVYLALDTRLGRHVALKEYVPTSLSARSPDQRVSVISERHRETFDLGLRSFVNEAQLLASFDHPSLVKVYRFWEENGTAYMVMPYYQGPTLKRWLKELDKKPDEQWLLALLAPLLDALELLHNDNCYHRDIAPDNILLLPQQAGPSGTASPSVRPLLLDFGAARRVIGDMTQSLTVILKPGYAPIEQYAESTAMRQGPWTDVYALCAVLYNAITGKAPLPSVSRIVSDDMLPAVEAGAGHYSQAFLRAIDLGLTVRPQTRPQSMSALREVFAAVPRNAAPSTFNVATSQPAHHVSAKRSDALVDARNAPPPALDPQKTVAPPREALRNSQTPGPQKESIAVASKSLTAVVSLVAVGLIVGGTGWWLSDRSEQAAKPVAQAGPPGSSLPQGAPPVVGAATGAGVVAALTTSPGTANLSEPKPADSVAATENSTVPSANVNAVPFSVHAALQEIADGSGAQIEVSSAPDKTSLIIGKDLLKFRVKSSERGYLYVLFAGTDQSELKLLFPNQLDASNRIEAGRELALPRREWEVHAAGPPGTHQILVLVSRNERDFGGAGLLQNSDPMKRFDLGAARALWAQRPSGQGRSSPFSGRTVCKAPPCDETYGAALFEVAEVEAPDVRQSLSAEAASTREAAGASDATVGKTSEPQVDAKRIECDVLVRAGQRALTNRSYDDAMQRAEEAQAVYSGCPGANELARNARQAKNRARNSAVIQ